MITTTKTQKVNKLSISHDYNDTCEFNDNLNSTLFLCNGRRNSIDSISEVKDNLTLKLRTTNRRFSNLLLKFLGEEAKHLIKEFKKDSNYTMQEALQNLDIYQDCISNYFYENDEKLFDFISSCFNSIGVESETYSSHGYSQGDYVYCLTVKNDGYLVHRDYVSNILWDAPMKFALLDEEGEQVDSCGGFWDYETMKDYLPKEFANEKLENYHKENCYC